MIGDLRRFFNQSEKPNSSASKKMEKIPETMILQELLGGSAVSRLGSHAEQMEWQLSWAPSSIAGTGEVKTWKLNGNILGREFPKIFLSFSDQRMEKCGARGTLKEISYEARELLEARFFTFKLCKVKV